MFLNVCTSDNQFQPASHAVVGRPMPPWKQHKLEWKWWLSKSFLFLPLSRRQDRLRLQHLWDEILRLYNRQRIEKNQLMVQSSSVLRKCTQIITVHKCGKNRAESVQSGHFCACGSIKFFLTFNGKCVLRVCQPFFGAICSFSVHRNQIPKRFEYPG